MAMPSARMATTSARDSRMLRCSATVSSSNIKIQRESMTRSPYQRGETRLLGTDRRGSPDAAAPALEDPRVVPHLLVRAAEVATDPPAATVRVGVPLVELDQQHANAPQTFRMDQALEQVELAALDVQFEEVDVGEA